MATGTNDAAWSARAALLTPIAKAYGTDTGHHVAHLGVQVHGGMGFIEQTGAAQYARDVRITQIYEGTNGIQAMDLVGRKMMDNGDAAFALIDEMHKAVQAARPALAAGASDLRLLLQIRSNKAMNLWINDADPICLFIPSARLARGDFSELHGAVTQG